MARDSEGILRFAYASRMAPFDAATVNVSGCRTRARRIRRRSPPAGRTRRPTARARSRHHRIRRRSCALRGRRSPRAISTARSSSGVEISKSSRIDRCEASSSSPMAVGPSLRSARDGIQHPLVLGDHVPQSPEGLVAELLLRPLQVGRRRGRAASRHPSAARPSRRMRGARRSRRVSCACVTLVSMTTRSSPASREAERHDLGRRAIGSRGTRPSRAAPAATPSGP